MVLKSLAAPALIGAAFLAQVPDARAQDHDSDGVPDAVDAFPCEAGAVGQSYQPGRAQFGLIQLEDFWPRALDSDYNDTVVAYNYAFATALNGAVTRARLSFEILASGGRVEHALGIVLPVPATEVGTIEKSVGGGAYTPIALSVADPMATFTLSPNISQELMNVAANSIINAHQNAVPATRGRTLEVLVAFKNPVALNLGSSPFDVFTSRIASPEFPNDRSSHEAHMIQYCGTANMDLTLFGTGVDTSNRLMGICFTDQNRLPSGLHIPQVVGHPLEQRNIWQLYPQILQWAASGGVVNPGWYLSPVNGNQYPAQLTPTLPNGEADMKPNLACLPPAPLGTGFPSVAHRASSPSFKVQGTLGDFSASPGAMSSPSYTVRGGIAGANGQ